VRHREFETGQGGFEFLVAVAGRHVSDASGGDPDSVLNQHRGEFGVSAAIEAGQRAVIGCGYRAALDAGVRSVSGVSR
jgi:hypothetical protein